MFNPIIRRAKNLILFTLYRFSPILSLKMSRAKVGRGVFIGLNTYIELENAHLLTIADRVTIAAYSKLILHDSSLNNVAGFDILYGKIILNNNCYIGANTTILPGSVIGSNTIIGANSLV